MFNPEMMEAASKLMANMKPEDMQRMSEMASKMDPTVMQNMVQNMGGSGMGDINKDKLSQMSEQLKGMSTADFQAGMAQAQTQMSGQKQYMYNASLQLKNSGNAHIQKAGFTEALADYSKALENLKGHSGNDVAQLRLSLLLNSAICHQKMSNHDKAIETCDEVLKQDAKNVKALFRKGKSQSELGNLGESLRNIQTASELSPDDKIIKEELTNMKKVCDDRGIKAKEVKESWASPQEAPKPCFPASLSPSSPSSTATPAESGSSSAVTPGVGSAPDMQQAMDRLTKNPDMFLQATEAMQKMSPEDLSRMMSNAPLPPGMDAGVMKKQIEMFQKNPDMVKTAVESLKALPEEQRSKVLSRSGGGAPPDGMFDNPEMLKQMAEMAKKDGISATDADAMHSAASQLEANPELGKQMQAMMKNMPPDQLQNMMQMSQQMNDMGSSEGSESDMMCKVAEQFSANPDLARQMTEMMQNMPPEQMQSMMEMSQKMRSSKGDAGPGAPMSFGPGGGGPMLDPSDTDAMDKFMSDPQMVKAAEEMMKNMSPETLASMARSSGIDIDEDKTRMLKRILPFLPWILKGIRWFGAGRKAMKSIFTRRGKMIVAVLVLAIAYWQHQSYSA